MRTSLLSCALLVSVVACAACLGDPKDPKPPRTDATVTIPPETKLLPAPTSEPEELPAIDTSELTQRERSLFWRWASQLYSPCPSIAVSVATCVKENRPCAACGPAARFLVERARSGDSNNEAIVAFATRFSPDIKKVDLADSPAKGPASAKVTVVVWSDYECPACGHFVPLVERVFEKHKDEIRLVHKLYPLNSHSHSRPAARAALAAKKQGKYWEMEKVLFSHQKALEDADLEGYAKEIGLDLNKFRKDFADTKAADEIIDRDRDEADKHGLTGTPFILINGREIDLALFKIERDLEPWILTELEIIKKQAELDAIAALGATLQGQGLGPVGPLSTGVPATPSTSGAPSATPVAPSGSAAPSTAPVAPSAPGATPATSAAPSAAPTTKAGPQK